MLDASALLAYLQNEPGATTVRDALALGCRMSAVNWAEVLSKANDAGRSSREIVDELTNRGLLGQSLRIVPFAESDAATVGDLRPRTRHIGLSLGDRACLALGLRLQRSVLTTDRDWRKLTGELEVDIRVIR